MVAVILLVIYLSVSGHINTRSMYPFSPAKDTLTYKEVPDKVGISVNKSCIDVTLASFHAKITSQIILFTDALHSLFMI